MDDNTYRVGKIKQEMQEIMARLEELKETGLVDAYTVIVGACGETPEAPSTIMYRGCCVAHLTDFLAADITTFSPDEELRAFAREQAVKDLEEVMRGDLGDIAKSLHTDLSGSPYEAFRNINMVPPSDN